MSPSADSLRPDTSVLRDRHRVAAARRLMVEVPGPATFDRLSALAARLLGATHAKVTLLPEQDVVIGGYGLPAGVVGGPAQLTGAFSAVVVVSGEPLALPVAADDERVAHEPAVTSGQVRSYLGVPLTSASGHVLGVLAVYEDAPGSGTTRRSSCCASWPSRWSPSSSSPRRNRRWAPPWPDWRWRWRPAPSASGNATCARGRSCGISAARPSSGSRAPPTWSPSSS